MNCVVNFSFADEKFCLTFWRHKQTFFFLYKHEFFNFGLGSYCRPSGRICSLACMRKSRLKKYQIFQSLSLFSILYDHSLKFSNNRDKEFLLGIMYFNFPRTGNYTTSCTEVIYIFEVVMKTKRPFVGFHIHRFFRRDIYKVSTRFQCFCKGSNHSEMEIACSN